MYTADDYATHIEKTFVADKCKVVDFYVVPDYTEFLGKLVDSKFSRYCKKDFTQHQFIFESVDKSDSFPLGCKTTYRAYAADAVVEIKQEPNEFFPAVNMVAYQAKPIRVYPQAICDEEGIEVVPAGKHSRICILVMLLDFRNVFSFNRPGMTVTVKVPNRLKASVKPQAFTRGSREAFDKTMDQVRTHFHQEVIDKWEAWERQYIPKNDDAQTYIET
jgi:hypothetical protein